MIQLMRVPVQTFPPDAFLTSNFPVWKIQMSWESINAIEENTTQSWDAMTKAK